MKFFAVFINNLIQTMIFTTKIMLVRNTPGLKVLKLKHLLYERTSDVQIESLPISNLKCRVDPEEPTLRIY